jgi:hypothetical protein
MTPKKTVTRSDISRSPARTINRSFERQLALFHVNFAKAMWGIASPMIAPLPRKVR